MGRRRRRRKQLLDDLKGKRGYWKLKQEAVDRTVWRTGCGPVVRQTLEILLLLLLLLIYFYHLYAWYLKLYTTIYYVYVGA